MSLYGMQKFLYHLNRDPAVQGRFHTEPAALLDGYPLTKEERAAIETGDIGLIYVLGVNGQLLMHYAAYLGMPWADYIQSMRGGVAKHGAVRAGVYAMTTAMDQRVAGV
ncbi:MAG TPA: aromatic ring-opening dioxygenase subunit LigA [Variovorax sp.]|nr:aromatic ring-opening dioxygenase subunit LigA [Variovorax sp.]